MMSHRSRLHSIHHLEGIDGRDYRLAYHQPLRYHQHRRMHKLIEDLQGIKVDADDFLVIGRGKTKEEGHRDHDRNLINFQE